MTNIKIPKYVEKLIQRREKLAWELMKVSAELDEWLEKNDLLELNAYTNTGCMIYCEPDVAASMVRQDILNKE